MPPSAGPCTATARAPASPTSGPPRPPTPGPRTGRRPTMPSRAGPLRPWTTPPSSSPPTCPRAASGPAARAAGRSARAGLTPPGLGYRSPQVGSGSHPHEGGPHHALLVGQEGQGHDLDPVALVQVAALLIGDLLVLDHGAGQHTRLGRGLGTRVAGGRREHRHQPGQVGPREVAP